jgi:HMG (high mobility group) box
VASDPATSTFRIFGLSAATIEALAQLGATDVSLAGSPLESLFNQTKGKLTNKVVASEQAAEATGKDKEKQAKIPRPPNAFILYRQAYHPLVKAENPEIHNNDICKSSSPKILILKADDVAAKVLGQQWKDESPGIRQMFKAKALERKAEHLKMYPGYQYAPRRPGVKKHRASRKDMKAGGEKENYESLRFIDQEGDFWMASESGVGDDDMDVIGTKVDDDIRRFHIDGNDDIGVVLPAAEGSNLTKMVEAHNKHAEQSDGATELDPAEDFQVETSAPPHVQNDSDFFEALIDWEGIAEDFKIVQQTSGDDLAGLRPLEDGNPYLSLSDEDQRALFEAELERILKFFD